MISAPGVSRVDKKKSAPIGRDTLLSSRAGLAHGKELSPLESLPRAHMLVKVNRCQFKPLVETGAAHA